MKKFTVLILAAAITVAIAGCVHKNPTTDKTSASATNEHGEEITTAAEENGSVNIATEPTRLAVTDAEGNRVTQSGTQRYTRITLYTTRAPAPDRLTQRPTTTERVTIPPAKPPATKNPPKTTRPTTTTTRPADVLKPADKTTSKPSTTAKPATTSVPFKAPEVVYSGTYGTDKDKIRIKSHEAMLAQSGSILITLQFEIVEASGTVQYVNLTYDCYDAAGNKINKKPVNTIAPVKAGETASTSIATAPLNTAKIVFINN